MKQKKKSNKQWRREIIANVKRREAERRKEKWRIRKCRAAIGGVGIAFYLLLLSIMLLNVRNTFPNLILGLIAINGGVCLSIYILSKAAWNLNCQIPLKNDGSLENMSLPDYLKSLSDGKCEVFSRIDDKQIVIDSDSILLRIFFFLLFLIMFLYAVYSGLTPSKLSTKGYATALLLLEFDVFAIVGMINNILKPWRRIVFDRLSKTITIPPRFLFGKKETIPYEQAVLTFRHYRKERPPYEAEIIISNSHRPLSGISLGINGDIDAAKRFARFIQIYMEEEELIRNPVAAISGNISVEKV